MVNVYPKEYLDQWAIKDELVESKDEADQLKKQWSTLGFTCSRKKYNFGFAIRYKVVGLHDKTGLKTSTEIRRELKKLL